jgi:hypothetical protein
MIFKNIRSNSGLIQGRFDEQQTEQLFLYYLFRAIQVNSNNENTPAV